MKNALPLILFFAILLNVKAQQKVVTFDWDGYKELVNESGSVRIPNATDVNFDFEDGVLIYRTQWKDNQYIDETSVTISNINYETVSKSNLYDLSIDGLQNSIDGIIETTKARGKFYSILQFSPYIYDQGVYKRVTSVTFNYSYAASAQRLFDVPEVGNSVLATGNWFKFYVQESGVYKIDKSFLSSLGINVSQIDPRTLKIYGYGGEMLPLRNGNTSYYDLPELSIKVRGESDGSFDAADYVLFYATGVDQWNEESNTSNNVYTDIAYYYITYGGDYGNRIQVATQPAASPSYTFTNYDDYQFHEVDEYSPIKVGRRWYGEIFNVENEQTFSFDLEDLDSSEDVNVYVSAVAVSSVGTSMAVSANGQSIGSLNLSGTSSAVTLMTGGVGSYNASLSSEELDVTLSYNNAGNPSSLCYLDYLLISSKRLLKGRNSQYPFTREDAANLFNVGAYSFSDASGIDEVWDVTDMYSVTTYENDDNASDFSFKVQLGSSRKYVVVDDNDFYVPGINSSDKTVANQNLKGTIFQNASGGSESVDYIIVTPQEFVSQANRLASFHENDSGLNVRVVTLDEIYSEFSTGNQDIAAIRNLIKYVYDNASSADDRLKYVCLFGDGSYDYKDRISNNTNFVPLYHNVQSFSLATSYATDDFYGMMDATEGDMSNDLLDVAVGRIIARDLQEATEMVDKIVAYRSEEAMGRWRNNVIQISDDGDDSTDVYFQFDLDAVSQEIATNRPSFNVEKIYEDAYIQQSSSGGERYPDAKEELLDKIKMGVLSMNYFGHGGEEGLSSERLFQSTDIQELDNENKYPLFITITCDFTRFDNPELTTGGEYMFLNPSGGAIALVATTREIYITNGINYNPVFAEYLYSYNSDDFTSMAESVRLAKIDLASGAQKRLIHFIGDPALKLAIPKPKINLTHINDIPVSQSVDTLKALSTVKLSGNITNANDVLLNEYNGTVFATVYDKNIERTTLGNDGVQVDNTLVTMDFETLGEVLFRGKATVTNGEFEFNFVVPRDALIPVDEGRVSFYAYKDDKSEDQTGYNTDILVGGLNENAPADNEGPEITLYMNDENFIYGGMTNQAPIFLAFLEDENGINTSSGIGHDIVAILDGDETNPYVMNDYYEADTDVYTSGAVNYPFSDLEPGLHTITFKAWDTYNNSSTAEIQFLVVDDDEMKLEKVLNYPNPFVSYTEFWFQHNKPFEPLDVQVQVFTVSGKIVWTHNQTITTEGYLSREITWDGRDDFGDKIGKGVYVYKITVKSTLSNKKAEKYEKLVIL
ncbi:Por secretion system C-terminal sorting domain-containing protein [Pustulibacterium marinum]|uniref:Por secretion system C-terminal sorting domain-containing protein n=1 Tax=Pustulibacterium marinum TaxID=1224947 RepID=A0A1I7F4K2_9FLAO|nr:type IX secretion system sortase PorU [Pustulibacterium marinum]SFU31111.1 Por secretion system C-terminal sorting domain-containing protein [Pustulibacterium marinum]